MSEESLGLIEDVIQEVEGDVDAVVGDVAEDVTSAIGDTAEAVGDVVAPLDNAAETGLGPIFDTATDEGTGGATNPVVAPVDGGSGILDVVEEAATESE